MFNECTGQTHTFLSEKFSKLEVLCREFKIPRASSIKARMSTWYLVLDIFIKMSELLLAHLTTDTLFWPLSVSTRTCSTIHKYPFGFAPPIRKCLDGKSDVAELWVFSLHFLWRGDICFWVQLIAGTKRPHLQVLPINRQNTTSQASPTTSRTLRIGLK